MSTQSDLPAAPSESSSATLQTSLMGALQVVSDIRKTDRSTVVDCTKAFGEFFRYRTVEAYVSFFRGIGISEIRTTANQKHFVYWELNYRQLRSSGGDGFLGDDRLVIALTVDPISADAVTSYKATLLNTNHP